MYRGNFSFDGSGYKVYASSKELEEILKKHLQYLISLYADDF